MPMNALLRLRSAKLYLLLTRSLCRHDPLETLDAALAGGVDIVQIREKPLTVEDTAWVERVQNRCHDHDALCIVNDDARLALWADGLHLGQEDLEAFPKGEARRAAGLDEGSILGISTHDMHEVERAAAEAPDYFGVGPCHPTSTKGYDRGLTPAQLEELVAATEGRPAFAIGGITPDNLAPLLAARVRRIAVSRCILAARDPRAVAARLAAALPAC
ncbi:MAG: thiamine phosphate synthase [Planctomycetes bacterium]|nr:thiamine phosphate synthase [Planctomycetota bacterium]MCB9916920.1 thiamine phosphate synthase [Planctomycetota bacterium]